MKLTSALVALFLVTLVFSCSKNNDDPSPTPGNTDTTGKHINDSLWAYYPIRGSVADSSGHNHTLVLNGGAALTYDQWGNDQSAINFDGVGAYGSIADGTQFPASDFTISLIIMPRQNKGFFFGKQNYATGKGASFNVGIDNATMGPQARFSITTNQSAICTAFPTSGDVCSNPNAFYSYAWYQVVATFQKGTLKLYINGKLVNTQTSANTVINNCSVSEFILGGWWTSDKNAFDGKMDAIRVYTRVLSSKEVQYLFDNRL